MSLRSNFFISSRYIFGRSSKGERYLLGAAAGIALSLIPIMVTLIVTDGMIKGITERFLELSTGHIRITPFNSEIDIDIIQQSIQNETGVRGIWKEKQGIGIILGAKGKTGVTIRAVEPSFWEDEGSKRYLTVIDGSTNIENNNDVLLGRELAKTIGAKIGDKVRIMMLHTDSEGKTIPRTALFNLRGIISAGYHEIDSMWCIISYDEGQKMLSSGDSFLVAKIDDPFNNAEYIANNINWTGSCWAYTWKEIQPAQYNSYESTRQLLLFIMALIVLVAAVNVSAAISMLVIERESEIAVLKTFGAAPSNIHSIFMFGSFLTGLIGAVTGITAGLFIGININRIIRSLEAFINIFSNIFNSGKIKILDPDYYLESIPIIIDWHTVLFIGIFTIMCALVSSWFPAFHAGSTKPVELLRKH
jgi:lipoprotein-releasing system permease protein